MKKIFITLFILFILMLLLTTPVNASLGGITPLDSSAPSSNSVHNLSTGKYNGYVDTIFNPMYTDTCFTGASTIAVTIHNTGDKEISVDIFKRQLIGRKII